MCLDYSVNDLPGLYPAAASPGKGLRFLPALVAVMLVGLAVYAQIPFRFLSFVLFSLGFSKFAHNRKVKNGSTPALSHSS